MQESFITPAFPEGMPLGKAGVKQNTVTINAGFSPDLCIMTQATHKYSNGEVTIVWQPHLCIHSGNCFGGLPEVFKPREKPWITPEGSTTEKIIQQVKKCPSGALSYIIELA